MGKIIFKDDIILSQLKLNLVSDLQKSVIKNIAFLLKDVELNNLEIDSELGIGAHGNYVGAQTYLIKIDISFLSFEIDFFVDYDQLEYYIYSDKKIIKQCILENYINNELIVENYIAYLHNDLKKIRIIKN